MPNNRSILSSEIRDVAQSKSGEPGSLADGLIQDLGSKRWSELSDQIGRQWIAAQIRIAQRKAPDSRQLDLPGFEHVRVVDGESLEQYRAETARLALRLKSYDYLRRSPVHRKEDELVLRERKRLDARIAPYFAADPTMTVERAVNAYRVALEKPSRTQRKQALRARWARTKNQ